MVISRPCAKGEREYKCQAVKSKYTMLFKENVPHSCLRFGLKDVRSEKNSHAERSLLAHLAHKAVSPKYRRKKKCQAQPIAYCYAQEKPQIKQKTNEKKKQEDLAKQNYCHDI